MEEVRNASNILVGKPYRKKLRWDIKVHGRIILKLILKRVAVCD
jgi:hypothetical protein